MEICNAWSWLIFKNPTPMLTFNDYKSWIIVYCIVMIDFIYNCMQTKWQGKPCGLCWRIKGVMISGPINCRNFMIYGSRNESISGSRNLPNGSISWSINWPSLMKPGAFVIYFSFAYLMFMNITCQSFFCFWCSAG